MTGSELHSPANDVLTGEDPQVPDTFEHEQNMIIDENGVRVLMAGCAHKGVVNIINRFFNIESAPPAAVIGGFHLAIPGTGDVNLPWWTARPIRISIERCIIPATARACPAMSG